MYSMLTGFFYLLQAFKGLKKIITRTHKQWKDLFAFNNKSEKEKYEKF